MKNERIWSNVRETTSHLQNKLTKNIHLGVATRSSTKWDCLKPIRFHLYTLVMGISNIFKIDDRYFNIEITSMTIAC